MRVYVSVRWGFDVYNDDQKLMVNLTDFKSLVSCFRVFTCFYSVLGLLRPLSGLVASLAMSETVVKEKIAYKKHTDRV